MNNLPRQKLCELITRYGQVLCDDPGRCEGLLRDLCAKHRGEVNVLMTALRERVATDLLNTSMTSPIELLISRLIRRLQDHHGMTDERARWAVESWALALGKFTEAELRKPEVAKHAGPSAPEAVFQAPMKPEAARSKHKKIKLLAVLLMAFAWSYYWGLMVWNVERSSPPTLTEFFAAIAEGNLRKTNQMLDRGVQINESSDDGWTPLHYAMQRRSLVTEEIQLEIVASLLSKGAYVEAKTNAGKTPLHIASFFGFTKAIDLLLARGADINAVDNDGRTALHSAVSNPETVKYLLAHGAVLNTKDNNGVTPLRLALMGASGETADLLRSRGERVSASRIHDAAAFGDISMVKSLLPECSDINARDEDGYTLLHEAVLGRHGVLAALLLEARADPNSTDSQGQTPLHLAASSPTTDAARLLLNSGAQVNIRDISGKTPLQAAIESQQLNREGMSLILREHGGEE